MHVCCGPCTLYPLKVLRAEGYEVVAYFHNPNIHPYQEFKRRVDTLETVSKQTDLRLEIDRDYGMREFLRQVVPQDRARCGICYRMRLEKTAALAASQGFDAFTSTLLYSKYQNHELLIRQSEELANHARVKFLYRDFRQGWQEGIDRSIEMDLYRQPYCGCIYSEQERYDNRWKKKMRKARRGVNKK
ncbi:MAG: hypothetical protein CSA34_05640 [Desulfobulbus propionicus]|nr:MAG: hypothetical protein CSA34_05640 [Desulfobulbus propionicus]